MAGGNCTTTDYFTLVDIHAGGQLDSHAIEAGLLLATATSTTIPADKRKSGMETLLNRFVYTDLDRRSARATSLALALLKTLGRQIDDSDELGSEKAIDGLLKLALDMMHQAVGGDINEQSNFAVSSCNEALTCVANTMLLLPKCKPLFAESCNGANVVSRILQSRLVELATTTFLCGRCLFLSLVSPSSAALCVNSLDLPATLTRAIRICLDRDRSSSTTGGQFSPQQVMSELLKAAMSLCVQFRQSVCAAATSPINSGKDDLLPPEHAAKLADILQVSLDTLYMLPLVSDHLADPAKQAIAISLNFPTLSPEAVLRCWLPVDQIESDADGDSKRFHFVDRIFYLLATLVTIAADEEANVYSKYEMEIAPLALVLVRLITEHADVRQRIFPQVFPPDSAQDHTVLPEDRPGLSAKLVRLMRIPQGGILPGAVGDLLFALLGQNVSKFVLAVGYGNAAGYMLARGIEMPEEILRQVSDASGSELLVDPVTGRQVSQKDLDQQLSDMTDEEKEREAERLFVLFERLNKTGFIKVGNPVRAAAESGRLQEIESSDEEASGSSK